MSTFYHIRRVACASAVVSLLALHFAFAAPSGSVVGRVLDKETGDPLPGANVVILGTSLGASTDLDGKYNLRNVPTGKQSLRVTYIGYIAVTQEVTVGENATLTQEFRLTPQAIKGETVVVTGQAKGQMTAINQQLSSNSIINVVSSDKMKELPDANIAESIGRLPGISLQRNAGEANAVVVRGLSPKYNQVTIEGVPMSSTNYYDRGVDLSLLSDDLVRSVEVSKTLRPDQDADALGGTVNLTLKSAEPGVHYNVMGYGAYTHLRDTWNNYKFAGNVSDRFLDDQIGVLVQGSIEQKQLPSDQFNGAYATPTFDPTNGVFYVKTQSATTYENSVNRHRYGASVILDYESDFVDVKFFNVYDMKKDSLLGRTYTSNFNSNSLNYYIDLNETKTEQRTHSLAALFRPWGTELPVSVSYTKGTQNLPNAQNFNLQQTSLPALSPSLVIYGDPARLIAAQGVMDAGNVNSTLTDMSITNTQLTDESYDARLDWKVPFRLSDAFSGKLSAGGKYHSVDRTSDREQVHDYLVYGQGAGNRKDLIASFPFLNGLNTDLQAGIPASPFPDANYTRNNILGYPIGSGFNAQQLVAMQTQYYWGMNNQWRYFVNGVPAYDRDYTDKEHTWAGYLMAELNIGSNLTVVPGARYQDEVTDISAYHIQLLGSNQNGLSGQAPVLVESQRNTPGWYPSVNAKYKATENIQVVGAVYKSLSLPSYGDINPLVEYDGNTPAVITANPMLKPSTAWNFDLGGSYSSNDVGLVTVNLFYKEISDLIYAMQGYTPFYPFPVTGAPSDIYDRIPGPTSGYYDSTWAIAVNGKSLTTSIPMNDPAKAYLRGIEISWQTHLWYLPGLLSGIVLDLNASYMSSRQVYPSFLKTRVGGSAFNPIYNNVYQTVEGPLQDQPKAIYNAILGWDYLGFSSRFSLRYQQLTLTSMDTQYGLRNSYYDNILLFDISLKQRVIGNLSVFVNATNVNQHIDNYYYSHPAYGTIAEGQLPTSEQTYGWQVQLGVSFFY